MQEAVTPTPLSQSVPVRFGATLAANLVRIGATFLSGLVVAKGLGASDFGDLSFLIASFMAINLVLDMGTSSAFYTFVSRRRRRRRFFALYLAWTLGVQFGFSLLLLGLLFPDAWISEIWVDLPRSLVLLSFAATFLQTQIWMTVVYLGEARRRTVRVQGAVAIQAVVHLAAVTVVWLAGWLTVEVVFLLLGAEFLLLTLLLGRRLLMENVVDSSEPDQPAGVIRDFVAYCKPLALYGVVGFAYGFADRWLLQRFGGSAEQGIFSVGQQFANVSLIATVSMLNVFWKEIAEALEHEDHGRVEQLYVTVRRGLYFSAAWMSCLLIPYSREILERTVGESYASGWLPLALMLVYPVQQSLGQIQGMFFYASKETVRYTRVGVTMMALGIPLAFVLLAPETAFVPGLDLGAVGLALKLLVLQAIWVVTLAYILARSHGLTMDYGHQLLVLAGLLGLAFATKFAADRVSDLAGVVEPIVVGPLLYVLLTGVLLYRNPALAGFPRSELARLVARLKRRSD